MEPTPLLICLPHMLRQQPVTNLGLVNQKIGMSTAGTLDDPRGVMLRCRAIWETITKEGGTLIIQRQRTKVSRTRDARSGGQRRLFPRLFPVPVLHGSHPSSELDSLAFQ